MCERVIEKDPWVLKFVSDHLKAQRMCESALEKDPWVLKFVPDLFVAQEQVKLQYDDDYYCNNNGFFE